jgi:hypothetical protein
MAINNFNIFKRLSSDNPNERHIAADKLYESFKRDGGHPDDWELRRRGHHGAHILADVEASLRAAAELREQAERKAREKAELEAERQSEARAQAEAELSRLREQLRRAKRKTTTTEYVDLLSGLLKSSVIDAMGPDDIGAKIEALCAERDRREHNLAAQVDLVIGQLTGALYRCYAEQFGKRKRGSGTPTMTEYLEQYAANPPVGAGGATRRIASSRQMTGNKTAGTAVVASKASSGQHRNRGRSPSGSARCSGGWMRYRRWCAIANGRTPRRW